MTVTHDKFFFEMCRKSINKMLIERCLIWVGYHLLWYLEKLHKKLLIPLEGSYGRDLKSLVDRTAADHLRYILINFVRCSKKETSCPLSYPSLLLCITINLGLPSSVCERALTCCSLYVGPFHPLLESHETRSYIQVLNFSRSFSPDHFVVGKVFF